jgi:hypothetical protein
MTERPTKITFAEMRDMSVSGLLVYLRRLPTTAANAGDQPNG